MKIRLGYVAISLTLNITTSKTITYTNYKKIKNKDEKLDNLIRQNFKSLKEILKYNYKNNIHFYRLSHKLIPLATHNEVKFDYITPYKKEWKEIGNLIKKYKIRLDIHPDQFCVLNSENPAVVENTSKTLEYSYKIFKAMDIEGKAIMHVGGAYNNKEKAIQNFKNNFKKLKPEIQKIIILENDDKIYNIKDTLSICQELNIPMVLDYHHYICNNESEDINDYLPAILKTWKGEKLNPKMHFSSPKSIKEKRSHSDYINCDDFIKFINILKKHNKDIDVMLECKAKDEALFRLIRQLKYKSDFEFIDETTININ